MTILRRIAFLAPPTVLAGFVFVGLGGSASAEDSAGAPDIFTLGSEAVAIQSVYQSLNVPFGLPFAVGSYGASANLDGGGSTASAGAPYSPLVSSLPTTGNGVASTMGYQLPVVPAFPGFVTAQSPNAPVGEQAAGAYTLRAVAEESSAEGTVSIGGQGSFSKKNNLFALARAATAPNGAMTVTGSAGAVALNLPGILDIFQVASEVTLSRPQSGEQPDYTSTTNLGTITIAGLTTGLTGSTSQVAGAGQTPINTDSLPAINQALAPLGVSLSYLPQAFTYSDGSTSTGATPDAKKTIRGVTSGALQILIAQDVPGQGPSSETITLGQVTVSGAITDGSSVLTGAANPDVQPGASPGTAPSVDAAGIAALPVTPAGAVAAVPGQTVNLVPQVSAGGASDGARLSATEFSVEGTYPLLVVVALAALGGSLLTRLFAVRLWR